MNFLLPVRCRMGPCLSRQLYRSRTRAVCSIALAQCRTCDVVSGYSLQPVLLQFVARFCQETRSTTKQSSQKDSGALHLQLESEGKMLMVTWKDGSQSHYDSMWLRHNCQCRQCQQQHSGQRLFDAASIPDNIALQSVDDKGDVLVVQWLEEKGHVGALSPSFLKEHCYEHKSLERKRDAGKLTKPPVKSIPELNYNEFVQSKRSVLRWLKQINEAGISLLKGVPIEDGMVCKVAEQVGPVMKTIYGESFDVVSTDKPINVAYSNVALDLHMDLAYYESPPGLQLLHCLRFDKCVDGGKSTFLDVFPVAEKFRKEYAEFFFTLSHIPATFQKIHYERDLPVDMQYQRPHIVLNHYEEIVGVNWAPAFEGPLAVEQSDVLPYYEAYEVFANEIKFSSHIIEYQMQSGDLITFNNRRMLHGRTAFELNGGMRHLKGCYVNIDHFKNSVQVYSRLYGNGETAKRVGNQDWF